jgi:hypothetical protein
VDSPPKEPANCRQWLLAAVLIFVVVVCWMSWPHRPGVSPYALSSQDGKVRFYRTSYQEPVVPPSTFPIRERLLWGWIQFKRHYLKANPAAYSFPPARKMACSITALLDQCMQVSGKQYLVAVEIRGEVEFGSTATLNGQQFVAAFERALETSSPVSCYDYGKKSGFEDTLVVIHEGARLVKVIPRSKLGEYQRAGLVKGDVANGRK